MTSGSPAWRNGPARDGPGGFPPEVVVQVKALACELPARHGAPLARGSVGDVARATRASGLVATISTSTVWRWLHAEAIRPWPHRCWIFPRDPDFVAKAGRILDRSARRWEGQALRDDAFVLSADEKTSIQARVRCHATRPPQPGQPMKVEHAYTRGGALASVAAWDVHRANLFGRCEAKSGIAPFDRLVAQVMAGPPYAEARRVFWIVDNGSAHRGPKAVARLQAQYPHLVLVQGPVHASWLNQIESYFSIVHRKVLTPNAFPSLAAVAERLLAFERYYETLATPFRWTVTRADLTTLLQKMTTERLGSLRAAA
jgi:hypothetical protein